MAVMGISAAMAAGAITWPGRDEPPYVLVRSPSTVSFVDAPRRPAPVQAFNFSREIAQIYADLSAGQEPLGAEFEAAWDAIAPSLYEA